MNTELQGIASKYSEAMLELAISVRAEDKIFEELKLIAAVIASDREMSIIINHPSLDTAEKKLLKQPVSGQNLRAELQSDRTACRQAPAGSHPFYRTQLSRTFKQTQKYRQCHTVVFGASG